MFGMPSRTRFLYHGFDPGDNPLEYGAAVKAAYYSAAFIIRAAAADRLDMRWMPGAEVSSAMATTSNTRCFIQYGCIVCKSSDKANNLTLFRVNRHKGRKEKKSSIVAKNA